MIKTKSNDSDSSLNQMLEGSCFGFMFFPLKRKPNRTIKPVRKTNQLASTMIMEKKTEILRKPLLQTSILKYHYVQGKKTWDQFVKRQDLIGIVGKMDFMVLPINPQCWIIEINSRSQIQCLSSIRANSFSFIFAYGYDPVFLKNILSSNQKVTIKCKSDEDLISLVKMWESVIKEEAIRKGIVARKIIPKLKLQINTVNRQYWVTINFNDQTLFEQGLNKIGVNKKDIFIFKQIFQYINTYQYWQLQKMKQQKQQKGCSLSSLQIKEFLTDKGLRFQEKEQEISPNIPPLLSSPQISPPNQKFQKPRKVSSSSQGSMLYLHKIDRFEGLDEELQQLQIIKERKYRTKSCSLKPIQDTNFQQLWTDQFILD